MHLCQHVQSRDGFHLCDANTSSTFKHRIASQLRNLKRYQTPGLICDPYNIDNNIQPDLLPRLVSIAPQPIRFTVPKRAYGRVHTALGRTR